MSKNNTKREKINGQSIFAIVFVVLLVVLIGYYFFSSAHKKNARNQTNAVTDNWTGAGKTPTWSNPSNWSNGVPKNGEEVVFSGSRSKSGSQYIDDNIPGLVLSGIKFSGKGASADIILSGYPLSIGQSGIVVAYSPSKKNFSLASVDIEDAISFSDNSSISVSSANILTFTNNSANSLQLDGFSVNVSVSSDSSMTVSSSLGGNGKLLFNSNSIKSGGNVVFVSPSKTFNGSVFIGKGDIVKETNYKPNAAKNNNPFLAFGNATIKVSGGTLIVAPDTSSTSYSLSNPMVLSGNGALGYNGAIQTCYSSNNQTCAVPETLNLTGKVSLSGNTELGGVISLNSKQSMTYNIKKLNKNKHTLTAVNKNTVTIKQ